MLLIKQMKTMIFIENPPWGGTEKSEKVVSAPQRKVMKSLSPHGVFLLIKPIENNEFAPPGPSAQRREFV